MVYKSQIVGDVSAAVDSVSNADGTLTISPTSGAVVASINLNHANTWLGQQTFVAPILGAATATSINKVALTQPASGSTLTIADGKTLSSSVNTSISGADITVTGSGTNTYTYPAATDTLMGRVSTDTFSNKSFSTNLLSAVPTAGLVLKQGANGRVGTFSANGATPVTVNNTTIQTTDIVVFSLNTIGGTVGNTPRVSTITALTSFAVTCTALDTSTYNYMIFSSIL